MPHSFAPSGLAVQPRAFLEYAERHAVVMRKLLRSRERGKKNSESGSKGDALRLLKQIELMAREGKAASAAKAVKFAEGVERLLSLLNNEF